MQTVQIARKRENRMGPIIDYSNLENSDLIVEAIYKGGKSGNFSDDPLHIIFPKCGIAGGFRKVSREDDPSKMAYVILYTTMSELEWPDYLDSETGVFRYYGDNRSPGTSLTATKLGGNKLLEQVFGILNTSGPYDDIPPFFIFQKMGDGRDVKFLGLAAPGNRNLSSDRDLVSFWRTLGSERFQNYEAYFTVLDTGKLPIPKRWLRALIENHSESIQYAPLVWQNFIKKGRNGIIPLRAPKILSIPTKFEQLQCDNEGRQSLSFIRDYYSKFPQGFESCAAELVRMMDNSFSSFNLTRPWRDGGVDAIGQYVIRQSGISNHPLMMQCALEAKCYSENNSVGVKQMSRLISRIKYRQFGLMVTTSYVNSQAYKEVVEDGHPILIVTATDIAATLKKNFIHYTDLKTWLDSIDSRNQKEYSFIRPTPGMVAEEQIKYEI